MYKEAIEKLIEQGRPSVHRGTCLYRSPCGAKCIVGHMISDEEYAPEMDNDIMAVDLVAKFPQLKLSQEGNVYILQELQSCHDSAASGSVERFVERFKEAIKLRVRRDDLPKEFLDYV
jgi:hypothetical protein